MFLKPDREQNLFGSRFNMVRPDQTLFNNIVINNLDIDILK